MNLSASPVLPAFDDEGELHRANADATAGRLAEALRRHDRAVALIGGDGLDTAPVVDALPGRLADLPVRFVRIGNKSASALSLAGIIAQLATAKPASEDDGLSAAVRTLTESRGEERQIVLVVEQADTLDRFALLFLQAMLDRSPDRAITDAATPLLQLLLVATSAIWEKLDGEPLAKLRAALSESVVFLGCPAPSVERSAPGAERPASPGPVAPAAVARAAGIGDAPARPGRRIAAAAVCAALAVAAVFAYRGWREARRPTLVQAPALVQAPTPTPTPVPAPVGADVAPKDAALPEAIAKPDAVAPPADIAPQPAPAPTPELPPPGNNDAGAMQKDVAAPEQPAPQQPAPEQPATQQPAPEQPAAQLPATVPAGPAPAPGGDSVEATRRLFTDYLERSGLAKLSAAQREALFQEYLARRRGNHQ